VASKDPKPSGEGSSTERRSTARSKRTFSRQIEGCGVVTVKCDKSGHWGVEWEPESGKPFFLSLTSPAVPLDFPTEDDPRELLWWAERYFADWCGRQSGRDAHEQRVSKP